MLLTNPLQYERAVIGMLLTRVELLDKVITLGLTPTSFRAEECRDIFVAMLDAEKKSRSHRLDALSVLRPDLTEVMLTLAREAPITLAIETLVEEVLTQAWILRAISEARQVIGVLEHRDTRDGIDQLRTKISSILDSVLSPMNSRRGPEDAKDVASRFIDITEREILAQLEGKPTSTIRTGMEPFDLGLGGGLSRGSMHTFAARTGVGKTTLAINLLHNAALDGHAGIYFSVEMPNVDIFRKQVSLASRVSANRIRRGDLDDDMRDRMMHGTGVVCAQRLWFDDTTRGSVEAVEATCRSFNRRGRLDFIVIDYLQQFRCAGRHASMHERVAEASFRFHELAKSLDIAVIALAQLNREAEKDGAVPEMRHIKESGGIEQDSDVVALLHAPKGEDMRMYVTKNRHGKGSFDFPLETNLKVNLIKAANVNPGAFNEQ